MVEALGSILRNGFETWKKNLTICLPFVFSLLLTLIVGAIVLGGALITVIGPVLPSLTPSLTGTPGGEIPPEIVQQLQPLLLQNIDILVAAVIIAGILVLLITTFFSAGAIGMANEATKMESTRLTDMTYYGARKFVSLLGANLIVALIAFAGVIFLIPSLVPLLPAISTSQAPSDAANMAAIAMLGLGFLVMAFYMLIISIILAISPYAVVISDLGAVDGVKSGFHFFMAHKVEVFLLWLVVLVIAIVAGIILGNIPYIGQWLSMAVSVIVIQPLSVIWWSRLYLSGTEGEVDIEPPNFKVNL
jgi:magnesium-transporting ATPase (P-type)